MACTKCNNTITDCGCNQVDSACLTYQGNYLECIPIPCGISLDAVIAAIDQKICEIVTSIINLEVEGNNYNLQLDVNDLNLLENGAIKDTVDLSKYLDNIDTIPTSVEVTGGASKTLTITLSDNTTVSTTFTDESGNFINTTNTSVTVTGGETKTLTINDSDGNNVSTTFTDENTTNNSLTVTGTDNKTITLVDSDGNNVQGSFTDLQGVESIVAGTNVTVDNTDPANPIVSSTSSGTNNTDLSYTPSPTQGTVTSSTGTNAIIPLANSTNAGLIAPVETDNTATVQCLDLGGGATYTTSSESINTVANNFFRQVKATFRVQTTGTPTGEFVIDFSGINTGFDGFAFVNVERFEMDGTNPNISSIYAAAVSSSRIIFRTILPNSTTTGTTNGGSDPRLSNVTFSNGFVSLNILTVNI